MVPTPMYMVASFLLYADWRSGSVVGRPAGKMLRQRGCERPLGLNAIPGMTCRHQHGPYPATQTRNTQLASARPKSGSRPSL
jgi:hypothetical protein